MKTICWCLRDLDTTSGSVAHRNEGVEGCEHLFDSSSDNAIFTTSVLTITGTVKKKITSVNTYQTLREEMEGPYPTVVALQKQMVGWADSTSFAQSVVNKQLK